MTDPDLTDQLRQAFETRASRVEPSADALRVIRTRVSRTRRRARAVGIGFTALATTVAVALVFVIVLLPHRTPAPGPVLATPTPSAVLGGDRLPVYFVGNVAGRALLYREYHPVSTVDVSLPQRLRAALTDMMTGTAYDPDYHTDWPTGATVGSVSVGGTTITVELALPAQTPADPRLALQQLIYTATAVASDQHEPQLTSVRIEVNGVPADRIWGIPIPGPLVRAPPADTLAPVWLTSPQQNDTVATTFTVQIDGQVPASVASFIIWNAAGATVHQQAVVLTNGDATVPVTLPPGRYWIEAYYVGDDGTAAAPDNHFITVR